MLTIETVSRIFTKLEPDGVMHIRVAFVSWIWNAPGSSHCAVRETRHPQN
ncbi:hypothetical protein [Bradyrhizobium sp. CCBAU 53415]